jgi:hypothetical protein
LKKCDIDRQRCGKGRYCRYEIGDIRVGVCTEKRVKNCKRWEVYAAKEICKTCVDGFELDLSNRARCVSKMNDWVIPDRRLMGK